MIDLHYPLRSLRESHWFKLICGASFQHLPAIRTLTLAYALAGADCVDVAADPAIIATAQEALRIAEQLMPTAQRRGFGSGHRPWLMASINDGEDPHFRKAQFLPESCPTDCHQPCQGVCPAQAIVFNHPNTGFSGVIDDLCYGCGRCLPVCPVQQISTRSYVSAPEAIAPLILQTGLDAIEIHTQIGRWQDFKRLWQAIAPWTDQLKLIAISCPDGEGLIDYLWSLYHLMTPLPCTLVWQTDGRPMSGDIGDGATRAAVKLGQKVLAAGLPGYVQLAGGTNYSTVPKLRQLNLLPTTPVSVTDGAKPSEPDPPCRQIAGVAYGSYARSLLAPVLQEIETMELQAHSHSIRIEAIPSLLWQTVELAASLVHQLKDPGLDQPAVNSLACSSSSEILT